MSPYQRKHHRRRRRHRFRRIYALLCVLLVLAAVIGGSIVFFRIDEVTVEGSSRYSVSEVISVSGIEEGRNMFLINKYQVIDRLLSELSYVDEVSVRRALPSTIQITVTECDAAVALQDAESGEWWLISSSGKLLERTEEAQGCPEVQGLTLAAPSVGTQMAVTEDQRLQKESLIGLLEALENRDMLDKISDIDLTSASALTFCYDGRLTVKLKLSADYDYETRVLETVMAEYVNVKWSETDCGTLDRTQDDGLTHLIKNTEN